MIAVSYSVSATNNDRYVFTWGYRDEKVTQGNWYIEEVPGKSDIFLFKNSSHNEYLINARDEHGWDRHYVYTSGKGSVASSLAECQWEMKIMG